MLTYQPEDRAILAANLEEAKDIFDKIHLIEENPEIFEEVKIKLALIASNDIYKTMDIIADVGFADDATISRIADELYASNKITNASADYMLPENVEFMEKYMNTLLKKILLEIDKDDIKKIKDRLSKFIKLLKE